MCDDPLIYPGHSVQKGKAQPNWSLPKHTPIAKEMSEQKGDLLILDLWKIGIEIIHNMCAVNIYTLSHQNKSRKKGLLTAEMKKKCKYL